MKSIKKTYPVETVSPQEHLELEGIRQGPRYSYRDAKLLCDMRDSYTQLAHKLDIHAKV